ncbi:hypothetical protein Anas_04615 [Armadillidium nasatum]|uniref:Glucose-methanol-choline oxidoreductase N-terminal domain-containing protein n=1 Tax=Armadillidium nasatum TaxID=96803 RepID=A0A5N5SHU7_9CRUS|nr:hypothetical protein Anas_04615 [Armadillidium nasatum]
MESSILLSNPLVNLQNIYDKLCAINRNVLTLKEEFLEVRQPLMAWCTSEGISEIMMNGQKLGNYGWSFEEVLPYFKKSEDNRITSFAKNKRYHSTKGELTVSDLRWRTPLSHIFIRAGQELGYFTGDYNAENQTAFSSTQFTIRDGFRCSTNKAFLLPAGKRKNLDVARNSHVTKVFFYSICIIYIKI